jgi:hypothetical protein
MNNDLLGHRIRIKLNRGINISNNRDRVKGKRVNGERKGMGFVR